MVDTRSGGFGVTFQPKTFFCEFCRQDVSHIYRQWDHTNVVICQFCHIDRNDQDLFQGIQSIGGRALFLVLNGWTPKEAADILHVGHLEFIDILQTACNFVSYDRLSYIKRRDIFHKREISLDGYEFVPPRTDGITRVQDELATYRQERDRIRMMVKNVRNRERQVRSAGRAFRRAVKRAGQAPDQLFGSVVDPGETYLADYLRAALDL